MIKQKLLTVLTTTLLLMPSITMADNITFTKEVKRDAICMLHEADKIKEEQLKKENEEKYGKYTAWLKGALKGQEALFVDYAIEKNVDPTLAIAISLFETGNGTSNLCVNNNNFGGMRGNGDWMYFETKEEGIKAYINNLSRYIERGADTPEKMATSYCEGSQHWIDNVNWFMNAINNHTN